MRQFKEGDRVIYLGETEHYKGLSGVVVKKPEHEDDCHDRFRVWVRWDNGEVRQPINEIIRLESKLKRALK